jgi:anti-anti-sigma factor
MNLEVDIWKKDEGFYFVALTGRLDTETYAFCEEKLKPILTPGTRVLTFDLVGLSYISSMGLRVVLKARKMVETNGGKVLTVRMQPQIAKIFEISATLPKVQMFTSIEEVDAYFDAMQKKVLEEQKK